METPPHNFIIKRSKGNNQEVNCDCQMKMSVTNPVDKTGGMDTDSERQETG
jgi:hypothetical protein